VTAEFGGVDSSDFCVSNPTTTLTIIQEDAVAYFTADCLVTTATATSTSAPVTLTATIKDFTDGYPGDIRNATVTFYNLTTSSEINTTPIAVSLVNSGDPTVGTVKYDWTASINSNDPSVSYDILVIVKNYYTGTSYEAEAIGTVTIGRPGSGFITGGGYLVMSSSAGKYAGDNGTHENFGFNVKYNKAKTNLQGHINTIIRRKESDGVLHLYQVKGNAMTSLSTKMTTNSNGKESVGNPSTATYTGKCNISDVTDPFNPISVEGACTMQCCMTDCGEPGNYDSIHFVVWDHGGAMVFSSNWTGTKTIEQVLTGGNLVVH
jgi:hypothetical protein